LGPKSHGIVRVTVGYLPRISRALQLGVWRAEEEANLEDTACLLIDEAGDTLDASTTSEAADGRLGDALDVVTKDLAVTLGTPLAEALSCARDSRR
jgi:hypothetical protein